MKYIQYSYRVCSFVLFHTRSPPCNQHPVQYARLSSRHGFRPRVATIMPSNHTDTVVFELPTNGIMQYGLLCV